MGKYFFPLLVTAMLLTGTTFAQPISAQPVTPGKWLNSWMLCGPFPAREPSDINEAWDHLVGFGNDFLSKYGGEQNPRIKAGDEVKFTGGIAKWKLYQSPDSIIQLFKAVSGQSPAIAYAYTEILSDEDKVITLDLGTNDGGRLWFNGLVIWDNKQKFRLIPYHDPIPVLLKKGKNTLLLKMEQRGTTEQRGALWTFCARFLPFQTSVLVKKGDLFSLSAGIDGEARITSKLNTPVLQQLIQNLSIEILNSQNQPVVKENRTTDFCGKVNLKPAGYQMYSSTLDIHLKNGENIKHQSSFFAGNRKNYLLFSAGKSDYRIALGAGASESEQWAAKELQH